MNIIKWFFKQNQSDTQEQMWIQFLHALTSYKMSKEIVMETVKIPADVLKSLNDIYETICPQNAEENGTEGEQKQEGEPLTIKPIIIGAILAIFFEKYKKRLEGLQHEYERYNEEKGYIPFLVEKQEKEMRDMQKKHREEIERLQETFQKQLKDKEKEISGKYEQELKERDTLNQTLMVEKKDLEKQNDSLIKKISIEKKQDKK